MAPLWKLCKEGNLAEVRAALARGEDVNGRRNSTNSTGLMLAVGNNHNSIVRLLLEQPTVDLNCTNIHSTTALHWAANAENVEAVRLILADPRLNTVNHKNRIGQTPVMIAMRYNKVNALRLLVAHPSVDLDTRDGEGKSLEDWARWGGLTINH